MARFKVRNPRAERWLADSSSSLITEITESTQDAVRFLLRDAMTKGRGVQLTSKSNAVKLVVNGETICDGPLYRPVIADESMFLLEQS